MHVISGDYGIRMVRRISVNVPNCLINAFNYFDADDRCQVFLIPILLAGEFQMDRFQALQNLHRLGVAAHLYAFGGVDGSDSGQKLTGYIARHQQALNRVARAVFVGFGVVGHAHGHVNVTRVIHIHVAVAVQVLDDGHFGILADAFNQPLAAPWND